MTEQLTEDGRNAFGIIVCPPEGRGGEGTDISPYERIEIDLSIAREDVAITFAGTSVIVEKLEGEMSFRPNLNSVLLPLSIYTEININFSPAFYISNTAQTGASATLLVLKDGSVTVSSPSDETVISSDYSNTTLSLTSLRSDVDVSGDVGISVDQPALGFTVVALTGATAAVRLGHDAADEIDLVVNMELTNQRFTSLFLSNAAQVGLTLVLFVPKG